MFNHWRSPFVIWPGQYEDVCWSTNRSIKFKQSVSAEEPVELLLANSIPQVEHHPTPLCSNTTLWELPQGLPLMLFITSVVLILSNLARLWCYTNGPGKLKVQLLNNLLENAHSVLHKNDFSLLLGCYQLWKLATAPPKCGEIISLFCQEDLPKASYLGSF